MPTIVPFARGRLVVLSVLLLLLLPGSGLAQTYVWNGSTSSHWGTASNWDGGQAPVVNSDLVFAGASIANLPIDNSGAGALQFRSFTFNSNLGAPLTISGQGVALGVGGITQSSPFAVNLNFDLRLIASQTWSTIGGAGLTVQKLTIDSGDNIQLGDAATQALGAFTLTGNGSGDGFTNAYTSSTSIRTATLWHNMTLAGSQRWNTTSEYARTVVNGNLAAGAGATLTLNDSNGLSPSFRFGGTNSAFLGDLTTSTANGAVILNAPSAMVAGRVLVNDDNRLFGITGASGSGTVPTYTFDYAAGTAPAAPAHGRGIVAFRGSGIGGLFASGTARWDPGAGSDYLTPTSSAANVIDLGAPSGSFFFPGGTILFGHPETAIANFVIRSDFTVRSSSTNPQNRVSPFQFDYALSDDGTARNFTVSAPLTILTRQRAVSNSLTASANLGGTTTITNGAALSINGANRLFTGNLAIGGTLVFNGLSWNAFAGSRTNGTGANQYQLVDGGGFAARGQPVVIGDNSTTTSTFDVSFHLGTPIVWLPGGSTAVYQNTGVNIGRDTVLTGRRTIGIFSEGPGLTGTTGYVQAISGSLTDNGVSRGAVVVRATENAFFPNSISELVLGGTNSWTGSGNAVIGGWNLNSGPGGLIVDNSTALVRFASAAALPSGNGGQPAFLAALRNTPSFSNESGWTGFLFTGSAQGETYTLPAGMRILLGGAGLSGNSRDGVIGSAGGSATLAAAPIYINMTSTAENARNLSILVRDGTFTLGTGTDAAGAVSFVATRNSNTAGSDTGINGAASTVIDRNSGFTTLGKLGPGLLILQNVRYTDIAGTGPFTGGTGGQSLTWNVGSGIVRDNALDLANFGSAAINLGTTIEGRGSMTRAPGFLANQLTWTNGGFAAVGGPLTIDVGGSSETLNWGQNFFMGPSSFVPILSFGSANSDNVVSIINAINLNGGTRTITVVDNPNSTADFAVIAGNITGTGTGTNGLIKTGSGRLDLQGANNDYSGTTTVSGGRLNVNGTLAAGGTITVQASGTLGGTGSLSRAVAVVGGGTLNPGTDSPGALTVNSNVVFDSGGLPATFAARLASPTSADQLVLNGSAFLNSAALNVSLQYAPTAADRFFLIVNDGTDAIGNTFAGLPNGQSLTLTFNSTPHTAWIYYTGDFATNSLTGGNDAVLSFSPVPEPASVLGLGFTAAVLGRWGLRRRHRLTSTASTGTCTPARP